jgi:hypothetical protein
MYEKIQFTALGKVGFNMDQYAWAWIAHQRLVSIYHIEFQ